MTRIPSRDLLGLPIEVCEVYEVCDGSVVFIEDEKRAADGLDDDCRDG